MKKMQSLILALACLLMGYSATLHAEDIDIYVDNGGTSGLPNVLIVLDNAAGFSANAQTCTYLDGTSPTLNGTAGGVEQCAMYNVVSGLAPDSVNLGVMVYNANNLRDIDNQNCGGTNGGCLAVPLMSMTAANKAKFLAWIKSWRDSGGAGDGYIKANGEATGAAMQESWAYYAGKTGLSGRDYNGVGPGAGCQKNFVIFIGNAVGPNGSPGDGGSVSVSGALAAAPNVTPDQLSPIKIPAHPPGNLNGYGAGSRMCGLYSMPNHTDPSGLYADEWARYMSQTDIYGNLSGNQGITTHTIGFIGEACKPEYPATLSSMAAAGGGSYYATSSYREIVDALYAILNEVQAVNSVFSSASLPVSVNADGTYLNQIYLGMFRPDSSGTPRWMGNLKQYQLVRNSAGDLVLGDARGKPAISTSGTGFITPTAVSFWTYQDTSTAPDDTGGFWVNDLKGTPKSGFDLPDGEVVEKGGVAQQLRRQNMKADFSSTEYSSTNPRKLYTYCPKGTGCVGALTDPANAFAVTNATIPTTAFGASVYFKVSSIVRTGTTAVVTTAVPHNFAGRTATIIGADDYHYNTRVDVPNNATGNTFTITGLPDYPTSPSQGTYRLALWTGGLGSSINYDGVSTVTVRTNGHNFAQGSTVVITGAMPSDFNGSFPVNLPNTAACPQATCFTYDLPSTPAVSPVNKYQAVVALPPTPINVASISKVKSVWTVTTNVTHGFHVGQIVDFLGNANLGAGIVVDAVSADGKSFSSTSVSSANACSTSCGSVAPSATPRPIITLGRSGTTATATGLPANQFGNAVGATKKVQITLLTDNGGQSESGYLGQFTATCVDATCTTFTYTVPVSPPAGAASGTITVDIPSITADVAAASFERIGTTKTTARVSGVTAGVFKTGDRVTVAPTGASYAASESGYYQPPLGYWTVTCVDINCTQLTFDEPVTLSPITPATGANIRAYTTAPPDRDSAIRWFRGEDNAGDEKGPGNGVTVRPSVHGDVLHSRPVVLNYGSRGLVAYYGSNDGVYRAVNANQTDPIGSVPAGGELWGLILPEHYAFVGRLRDNSPELKFPSTVLPDAQPKDYFIDGPTGVYQKLDSSGAVAEAYLYLTMRRGGKFMYAIDVHDPTNPVVKWRISAGDTGFEELGQTWSRPRLTLLGTSKTPVLVFGGGYDPAEDSEPPSARTMGRALYVVDAISGKLIWSASGTCTPSATCYQTTGMDYAIPSDIGFVDRDGNGFIDSLYFGDLGGNIWRATVSDASPANWTVSKLASLGCSTAAGSCSPRRKFFFPPAVLSVGTGPSAYDMVSAVSGDREHPLKSSQSFNTDDRFFMIIDRTASGTATPTRQLDDLLPATTDANGNSTYKYDSNAKGFSIDFPATGEKGVNAPLVVNGLVYFSTNRPTPPAPNSCASNLGEAKTYAVSPFDATGSTSVVSGGGLPPSPVSGVVQLRTPKADGTGYDMTQEKFCIGCLYNCTGDACSALDNAKKGPPIPKHLRRTYWYKK